MTARGHRVELVPGEVLDGKYRVERLLGVGGMGAVYVAERLSLRDKVAIKSILSTQNTELNRARFLREARAAAAVRHPNIVQIFDFGEPPGRPPYMVMEYLAGPTLAAVIRDYAPLPLPRALWIFSGVCAAVEAGHRRGVVHRDLKPGNVILARSDDGRETVKVLDFGLARLLMDNESSILTSPGTMLGTCSYMAPELIEASVASKASDIYALGVLLYEMVTGQSPFRAENNAATIWKITTGEYERPTDLVPDLPAEICAGIEAALAHRADQRPRSPEELAARVGAPLAASAYEPDAHGELVRERVANDHVAPARVVVDDPESAPPSEVITSNVGHDAVTPEPEAEAEGPTFSEIFVGRASQLEVLRREYRMAIDGRGRVVVIDGDAGVGKSALLGGFGSWARAQGATVLRGRFFAYEGDQPPPYETFSWMMEAPDSSGFHRRATLLATAVPRRELPPTQDKWRAFASLTQGFAERAQGRPLLLAVDDLQWATGLDLEFLAYLPRAMESPVLVVGTTDTASGRDPRGELTTWMARLGAQRSLATVDLGGFEIGEVRAWFQACFPGIRIRPQDLRTLAHVTSGNPYYLTEVVTQLVETRRIVRDGQGFACAPLDRIALPATVQGVVQAKLEDLDEELRTVLEAACVIGEEFRFEVLQAALQADEVELESQLELAVERRLLDERCRSPQADYRFENATLHGVLYEGLSRRKRRRLHGRVVEALLQLTDADDLDRIAQRLCYHYHAIEDHEGTLRWGIRAAARTLALYDHDNAEICLRRAAEAAAALTGEGRSVGVASVIDLDRLTGLLYVRIGRLEEADAMLQRARKAADRLADDPALVPQRLDIVLLLASCQLGRGLLEVSIDLGQTAIELAEQLGDRTRELEARQRTAEAAAASGQLDSAALLIEPMLEAAQDEEPTPMQALAMAALASIHAKQGAFERAYGLATRARELAKQWGDLQGEYRAISALGEVYLEGGDFETAREVLQTALELARRLSLRRAEAMELQNLALCHYYEAQHGETLGHHGETLGQGQHGETLGLEEAESLGRQALAIFVEIHDLASQGDCRVNLGRILVARDQVDEGIVLLEEGRELCATVGRKVYEGIALLEIGMADVQDGRLDDAREALASASAIFGSIDSLHLWRSELALATLALAEGDRPKAATHARRAAQMVDILRSRLGARLDQDAFARSVGEVREVLDAVMR